MKKVSVMTITLLLLATGKASFCSQETSSPTLKKVTSYDHLRNAIFKDGNKTLDMYGQDRAGYPGQIYAIGSDVKAVARWTPFIQNIKTIDRAKTLTKAIDERKDTDAALHFTEETLAPIKALLAAEELRHIAAANAELKKSRDARRLQFNTLNEQGQAILAQATHRRLQAEAAVKACHIEELHAFNEAQALQNQLIAIKQSHNTNNADDKISDTVFMLPRESKTAEDFALLISKQALLQTDEQYADITAPLARIYLGVKDKESK